MPLRALAEVQEEILATIAPLDALSVPLPDALGLALADAVRAVEPVPPFANSAMDGYAVRAVDTDGASPPSPARLLVVGELPAGRAATVAVGVGEAIRIMTGAPVPSGADAVVMVERTRRDEDHVLVEEPVAVGDHVRAAGGDIVADEIVFDPGTVLGPAHLGVLASLGLTTALVHRRPRVGVLSTGDELFEGAGPLAPGRIRDSNRPMLLALVADVGCEPIDLGIARDDEALITATLEAALEGCDAVLTSGGVSVGDYDYVKAALAQLGELRWSQVAIRPAKPLAYGVVKRTPVFGLPGNPVSSLVSFELFARPALLTMMGRPNRHRPVVRAVAGHDMARRADGKLHLDRVRVRVADDGTYRVVSTGVQASNVLSALASANGLALLPDGQGVDAGGEVDVMLLDAAPDH